MKDNLVDFLRARLDEDDAFAEMAVATVGGGEWLMRGRSGQEGPVEEKSNGHVVVPDTGVPDRLEAVHIARHNPARVRREVKAKLAILDMYRPGATDPHPGLPCTNSVHFDPYGDEYDPDVICERHSRAVDERPDGAFGNDMVLRLLALPYADHPDYRPEWAPDARPRSWGSPHG
ncbi:DUF6221 family protein [Streptomyces sp. NPDC048420]|uniref:DUF6221 family protein n=1 Tax=Streptomyces sp. NPDC048420 TaxID=3155755 RepID=UPI003423D7FC